MNVRLEAALVALAAAAGCARDIPVFSGPAFTSDPPSIGSVANRILTTNNGDDTLSVVDPDTQTVTAALPVGFIPVELEGPHHVAADPLGKFFFINLSEAVSGSGFGPHGAHGNGTMPGYVLKYEVATAERLGSIKVDPNPGDNTLSPDGKRFFVTHYDLKKLADGLGSGNIRNADSRLYVIDTDSLAVTARLPLCPAAHGVRTTPDGKTLYATCLPDEIAIVDLGDLSNGGAVRRVPLPGADETANCSHCPYAIGIAPDGTVWVSMIGAGMRGQDGGVFVYDPTLGTFDGARTIDIPLGAAVYAAFAHGPSVTTYRAYIPQQGFEGDFLRVYESRGPGAAPAEMPRLQFARSDCMNAHMLLLSADEKTGYVVCEGDHVGKGTLAIVDLAPMKLRAVLPLGVFPDGMALVPSAQ